MTKKPISLNKYYANKLLKIAKYPNGHNLKYFHISQRF